MALRSYQVAGTLRWGPVRIPVRHHVDVISVSDLEVVLATRQWPRTTLWITSQFQVDGDRVHVAVTVVMRAPSLLFPFAYRTGKAAHLRLAERVRMALEGEGGEGLPHPQSGGGRL